ncbi:MAG: metal ABC transporter substrate-binding protein [Pseudomonadota bacterium]
MRVAFVSLGVALTAGAAVAEERPRIVAVNYPLAFMAEALVGEAAEVVFPVPDGVDPSFWRPSIADISMMQSSDLILLSGAGFAAWIDRVSLPRSRLVDTSSDYFDRFIATGTITHSHGDGGEHSHEGTATYTWLDPELAMAQATAVAAAITARDLAPAADVGAALADLTAQLQALDEEAESALADAGETVFIATHPRYQYLARAYDLTVLSLEWEAGAMPNAAELSALEAMVADQGADVLIWEATPPDAALEAVASLGLASVTFPPLAMPPQSGGFAEAFAASVSALAEAVPDGSTN